MPEHPRQAPFGSERTTLRHLCLAAVVSICGATTAQGQVVTRAELLSGPWEVVRASEVDGILVMVDQRTTTGITRETIQVRVFHRKNGHETGGWHVVTPPESAGVGFDGRRLRVAGLTATFDPESPRWVGSWSLDGHPRAVVLERPAPGKGKGSNPLCGTWEGLPDAAVNVPSSTVRIHIIESADGVLTAWMDTMRVIVDHRTASATYGRSLKVLSADPANLLLQNEAPNYQTLGRFRGTLSKDANRLTGTWNGSPARYTFRRIPQ